jgi:hypothetical protein
VLVLGEEMFELAELFGFEGEGVFLSIIVWVDGAIGLYCSGSPAEDGGGDVLGFVAKDKFLDVFFVKGVKI